MLFCDEEAIVNISCRKEADGREHWQSSKTNNGLCHIFTETRIVIQIFSVFLHHILC